MYDTTVAKTIFSQIGGKRFVAMTGASSFSMGENVLSFRLPPRSTKNNIKGVRITLNDRDLYDMEFLKQKRAPSYEVYAEVEYNDVYFDMLEEMFTEATGLYTRL